MKTISQREFRNGSAAVMDAVKRGESFRITRNGVEVAELRPVPNEAFVPATELKAAFEGLATGDFEKMRAQADKLYGDDRLGE